MGFGLSFVTANSNHFLPSEPPCARGAGASAPEGLSLFQTKGSGESPAPPTKDIRRPLPKDWPPICPSPRAGTRSAPQGSRLSVPVCRRRRSVCLTICWRLDCVPGYLLSSVIANRRARRCGNPSYHSFSRALHVAPPTSPSHSSPALRWNAATAFSVVWPKSPSGFSRPMSRLLPQS